MPGHSGTESQIRPNQFVYRSLAVIPSPGMPVTPRTRLALAVRKDSCSSIDSPRFCKLYCFVGVPSWEEVFDGVYGSPHAWITCVGFFAPVCRAGSPYVPQSRAFPVYCLRWCGGTFQTCPTRSLAFRAFLATTSAEF